MSSIRLATPVDGPDIAVLLDQLGYPGTATFIAARIEAITNDPNATILVAEDNGSVVAFISINFISQLGLEGDFARISYFAVSDEYRGKGIGRELEMRCEELARARNCDRIEVHCSDYRTDAHRFYARQGYVESPKYLIKKPRR